MPLSLRWIAPEDHERLVETRLRCYGFAAKERDRYVEVFRDDRRAHSGDFLLAELDGEPVGTTTSLSMTMWIRGTPVACQGVAWVGTVRTHRRVAAGEHRGIASQLMAETLRKARERNQPVTALMPFRASFYQHFGYGLAERRTEWTVPLSMLAGETPAGMRYATPEDAPAIAACRQRFVERGQCDIETSDVAWAKRHRAYIDTGMEIIHRPEPDGPVHAWAQFEPQSSDRNHLKMAEACWDSPAALIPLLRFFGAQRDQNSYGSLTLPGDLPLNRLLKEPQIPHRAVAHSVCEAKPYTRMQIRVLDHLKLLNGMQLKAAIRGAATVAIQESEGTESRFRIELDNGRISAKKSDAAADITCPDHLWASIVSGDVVASAIASFGLLDVASAAALPLLDAFSAGPAPYCGEYF